MNHGTRTAYNYHRCRCDLCRAENARYRRDARRQPVPDVAEHGTVSTYTNWDCRCDECTVANKLRSRVRPAAYQAALCRVRDAHREEFDRFYASEVERRLG